MTQFELKIFNLLFEVKQSYLKCSNKTWMSVVEFHSRKKKLKTLFNVNKAYVKYMFPYRLLDRNSLDLYHYKSLDKLLFIKNVT